MVWRKATVHGVLSATAKAACRCPLRQSGAEATIDGQTIVFNGRA